MGTVSGRTNRRSLSGWFGSRARQQVSRCLLAGTAVCLAGLAVAGQVYRSVGPDGKVTYSDKPPTTDSTDVSKELQQRDPGMRADPVKAALNVYAKEVVVETAYRFCVQQAPQTASVVAAARNDWMQRHAALRAKKVAVLHDRFSQSELVDLATKMGQETGRILQVIQGAPLQERSKWCTNAPKTFAAPEFDLASKPELVGALMNYHHKTRTEATSTPGAG